MTDLPRRALVSVSDKSDLVPFAERLIALGFEIVSTGGTRRTLVEAGLAVTDVAEVTGFPEIMDGRVKTLHPRVHGGLLGRPGLESDLAAMNEHGIAPFELVVCNLYPFERTVAKPGVTVAEAIEQIDIGGPSMIRSAAKNHAYVGVVTSPGQYEEVASKLSEGRLDEELRRRLAGEAFAMTARYDAAITAYFTGLKTSDDDEPLPFPERLDLGFDKRCDVRYGENPHQRGAFYVESDPPATSLAAAEQRNGKELSYNNLLDLDAVLSIVREFEEPAAVVVKHNNPCGCAVAGSLAEAVYHAWAGDPVSAFGSIIACNRTVDLATAEFLAVPERFVEAVIAPGFADDAFEVLTTRPKWGKNVRLLELPSLTDESATILDFRRVSGGLLVQDRDDGAENESEWRVVTEREPSETELSDLRFGWKVCKHVKSNAIVFASGGAIVGVGAGQMSRLDSVHIAARKAGDRSNGAVLASDAFFPFRDGPDAAAAAGIKAIVQPGGSRRDDEVIAACNEHGIAMLFTGRRHFRH